MVCPDNRQPFDVASIVEELVWKVANNDRDFSNCHHQSSLPPLLNGEYDVVLPGKQISPYSYPYFYDCITH